MTNSDEQIHELLAGSVLGDLTDSEQGQLAELRTEDHAEFLWELHQTAAAVDLACQMADTEKIPQSLRDRIRAAAGEYVGVGSSSAVEETHRRNTVGADQEFDASAAAGSSGWSIREAFAWIACAAAILLCVNLTWRPAAVPPLSAIAARATLLQTSDSVVTIAWTAGPSEAPAKIAGDVVWDNIRQEGYMRFDGLPINDASVEQYQLWIIDPERDDEPIDGGVFDINQSGEVVVPINAKLPVVSPAAFAITIEKPGGVVVSTQERLPLIAAVQ